MKISFTVHHLDTEMCNDNAKRLIGAYSPYACKKMFFKDFVYSVLILK